MALEQFVKLISPPSAPAETGSAADWAEVEGALATPLPEDYKALIDRYGTGGVGDFLWILTPFTRQNDQNLLVAIPRILEAYLDIQVAAPRRYPFATYPDPGGLLPWAVSDNGDTVYWQTTGHPDQWSIVLYNGDHTRHETFDLSATEFLRSFFSGQLQSSILPAISELAPTWSTD